MTNANNRCCICNHGQNNINGRYCTMLHRYVEHDNEPKCQTNK